MEQVLGEPAEFISLHRLVQGENIPPAHLMNEAAVLRRASSSLHKEGVFSTCNLLKHGHAHALTVYGYENFLPACMHVYVSKHLCVS